MKLKQITKEEAESLPINMLEVKTSRGNFYKIEDWFDEDELVVIVGYTQTKFIGKSSTIKRKLKIKNLEFFTYEVSK